MELQEEFSKSAVKARLLEYKQSHPNFHAGFNLATTIASTALLGQVDKAGADYAHHFIAVSKKDTSSETKQIIAVLHDVVEDSDWTIQDLRDVGFSERIVAGVDAMTKRDGEAYFNFIERCSLNPDALDVKIKDLDHNLSLSRNDFLMTQKDLERINKYILSYNYLVHIKRGLVTPGANFSDWMESQEQKLQDFALLREHHVKPVPVAPAPKP